MPRGTELTEFERGQIIAFRELDLGPTEIGKRLKRAKSTISQFLRNPEAYGQRKRSGRRPTLTPRAHGRLIHQLSSWMVTKGLPITSKHLKTTYCHSPRILVGSNGFTNKIGRRFTCQMRRKRGFGIIMFGFLTGQHEVQT